MPKKVERGARPQGVVPLLREGRLSRAALILSSENPGRGREICACRRSAGRPTSCTNEERRHPERTLPFSPSSARSGVTDCVIGAISKNGGPDPDRGS
jgi:hypothetical protein